MTVFILCSFLLTWKFYEKSRILISWFFSLRKESLSSDICWKFFFRFHVLLIFSANRFFRNRIWERELITDGYGTDIAYGRFMSNGLVWTFYIYLHIVTNTHTHKHTNKQQTHILPSKGYKHTKTREITLNTTRISPVKTGEKTRARLCKFTQHITFLK